MRRRELTRAARERLLASGLWAVAGAGALWGLRSTFPSRYSFAGKTVLITGGSRGLGLTIVQALVTGELGGSIEMHSENGTSVRVTVPVAVPRVEL